MVYPTLTEKVVKNVNVARKYRVLIVPYSGGTSLEDHCTGIRTCFCIASLARASQTLDALVEGGGICVDMSEMDKIIAIHAKFSIN